MKPRDYEVLRAAIEEQGYAAEVEWAQTVSAPESAEALWREYAWVVLNSGMKNQVAERIWERVRPVVERGESCAAVYRHAAKGEAIDRGWRLRDERFAAFRAFARMDHASALDWCETLPWIGPITKYHLAKNLGVDCAKPDRWLERVAAAAGETVEGLCRRLAAETGDRVATVDLVIWRGCNLGLWRP